jgi:hypothetical protein
MTLSQWKTTYAFPSQYLFLLRCCGVGCGTQAIGQTCRTYGTRGQNGTQNISLALGMSHFVLPLLPHQRLYIVKDMCIYWHVWLRTDCMWITVATKQYGEWNIITPIGSCAQCWLDIYHWGAGLAVTGRQRDIGQNVLQSSFETGSSSSPVTAIFSSLSHSSKKPLLKIY